MYDRFTAFFSDSSQHTTARLRNGMAYLFAADGGEKLLKQFHPLHCTIAHCHSHLTLFQSASVTYRKLVTPQSCLELEQSTLYTRHSKRKARLLSPCNLLGFFSIMLGNTAI
jgi:hypothetical protein